MGENNFSKKIIIHNSENFIKSFMKMECGEQPFTVLDGADFETPFSEATPPPGYVIPENFPTCCDYHRNVFTDATNWFERFPDCCETHRKLFKAPWFNKQNYKEVPIKIVQQISYTDKHIEKQFEIEDWYKDITDYIDHNISTFGHLPSGFGNPVGLDIYIGHIKHFIKTTTVPIPEDKRNNLLKYVNGYQSTATIENPADLNVLHALYQKWLKIFPFEISFFSNLKEHFQKQLPILNGKPVVNKYTGMAKVKLHTKSTLIEALINLTDSLITKINGAMLYEKGLITNADKIKLELILNERKLELKQGYKNSSPDEEQRYRKILKKWFKDEKRFFSEISPLLKVLPPPPSPLSEDQEDETSEIVETFRSPYFVKNKDKLDKLYDLLVGVWIHKSTLQKNFKKIFHNEQPEVKIIWIKGKRELKYFIIQLKKEEIVKPGKIWTAADNSFTMEKYPGYKISDVAYLDVPQKIKGPIDHIINIIKPKIF